MEIRRRVSSRVRKQMNEEQYMEKGNMAREEIKCGMRTGEEGVGSSEQSEGRAEGD